ncbi:MAG: glycoside hydrolase family 2 [Bacteroidales bacterium]|nr:glycoside hydrolase family 2 [Bacteroidales bacterium]
MKDRSQSGEISLDEGFENPPADQRVGCYWYWIDKTITKEGIIADLEAMKKAGITRAYIGLTGGGDDLVFMSDQWWGLIHTAMKTASKLDIEIGMFNCPGWSQSGGPWIKPDQSMRYLTAVQRHISGPTKFSEKLAITAADIPSIKGLSWGDEFYQGKPEDFQDVKVLAFKVNAEATANLFEMPGAKVSISKNITLTDSKQYRLPQNEGDAFITLSLPKPASAQGLVLPIYGLIRTEAELQVKTGTGYSTVKRFGIDRTDNTLSRGFTPNSPVAVSFPEVTATEYRLVFRNTNSEGGLTGFTLTRAPVVERYAEKTLAKMFNSLAPPWDAFMWDAQTSDASMSIKPEEVLDISKNLAADGTLTWDVPEGEWVVLRTGMLPTGVQNSPVPKGAAGLEVDKLSGKLTEYHHDNYIGEVMKHIPAKDRKTFKINVLDSYEKGGQNITDNFIEIFKERYGYDPAPWFPAYFGYPVGSPELSDRFLWDVRRLVADRIAHEYVRAMREKSHADGLTTWLENYGSWGFAGEFLQYGGQTDEVGGEFWVGFMSGIGEPENRCATSCAHTYGKPKAWAEAFTGAGPHYSYYPGNLKQRGDWAFSTGINAYILHVYIQQQADNVYPGVDAWYNIQFNRKNTWFSQLDLFTDYVRRCGFMLQQGLDVSDVAYFIGEDAPKMCGITDPITPNGYHYDHINAEVLLNNTTVKDGKLTLAHGTQYRVLVLPPQETMRPEVARKILEFAEAGAIIIGNPPKRSPSMENYPAADKQVQDIASKMKDKIRSGVNLNTIFKEINLAPDFRAGNSAPVLYSHRRSGDVDIYFITNQSDSRIQFPAEFRVSGKQPEFWDAVSGEHRLLPSFVQYPQVISVPLQLEPSGSAFIVFRKPHSQETVTVQPPLQQPAIVIEQARYGKLDEKQFTVDATDILRKIVEAGNTSVKVDEITKALGDPKFGVKKTLQVNYKIDGKPLTVEAKDGEEADLLQPASSQIAVAGVPENFPEPELLTEITAPWTVQFESDAIHRGPEAPITLNALSDWTTSADPRIKYYSGTAVYKTTFEYDRTSTGRAYLDLGKVGVMAKVKINGEYAGGAWTPPYRVAIQPYLKSGANTLEIEVVNTWENRIIGDRNLPEAERGLTLNQGPRADAPLTTSGLLGPVTVIAMQ